MKGKGIRGGGGGMGRGCIRELDNTKTGMITWNQVEKVGSVRANCMDI
jgi:hypothetical protein